MSRCWEVSGCAVSAKGEVLIALRVAGLKKEVEELTAAQAAQAA